MNQADGDGDGIGDQCDGDVFDGDPLLSRCAVDVTPSATLLVPYFEIDLDDPQGRTTLLSVTNAHAAPQLTNVTIWTNWAVASVSFPMYLGGYDVATLNLRDLLVTGRIPDTGSGVTNQGDLSLPNEPFPDCAPALGQDLDPEMLAHLQAWHTGQASPSTGDCASSVPDRPGLAVGYITIDAVNRCSSSTPADAGYFVNGGAGVASNNNVLLGETFLVDPASDFAQGDAMVHIRADADRLGPNDGVAGDDYTFYARYVAGTGIDNRQPLGRLYGSRYLNGGAFDGATQLTVWRDTKSPDAAAITCGTMPAWAPLASRPMTLWDEQSNATLRGPDDDRMPWALQTVFVDAPEIAPPRPFGWMTVDLGHDHGSLFGDVAQGWVSVTHSASGRYSVGLRSIRLDTLCNESP